IVNLLNEKLKNNPKNIQIRAYLAKTQENLEELKVIWKESGEKSLLASLSIANMCYYQKNYQDAMEYYQSCLKLNRLAPHVIFPLGCCFMELGHLDHALDAFSQSEKSTDEIFHKNSLTNMAYIYMKQSE
ncbi:MAG: hypothetical protein MHPSP_002748, partial [Paramarteilia canceri]